MQEFLGILQLYLTVSFVEIYNNDSAILNLRELALNETAVYLSLFLPLISRSNWKNLSCCSLLSCLYLTFRFKGPIFLTQDQKGKNTRPSTRALSFLFLSLVISIASYLKEKFDRQIFYLWKNENLSSIHFKSIVKSIIPLPIVIFSKKTMWRTIINKQEDCWNIPMATRLRNNKRALNGEGKKEGTLNMKARFLEPSPHKAACLILFVSLRVQSSVTSKFF